MNVEVGMYVDCWWDTKFVRNGKFVAEIHKIGMFKNKYGKPNDDWIMLELDFPASSTKRITMPFNRNGEYPCYERSEVENVC